MLYLYIWLADAIKNPALVHENSNAIKKFVIIVWGIYFQTNRFSELIIKYLQHKLHNIMKFLIVR